MPLEVNELGIFMKVMEKESEQRQYGPGKEKGQDGRWFSKDDIVEACVARILEILERKNPR